MSDNGPCYASKEFKDFTAEWDTQHVTSSPEYPKSNGQAERTVRTVKAMLKKAKDLDAALLAYRNTPKDSTLNLSPPQMLMGRRLRTTVPQTTDMLIPQWYNPQDILTKLKERQGKQKFYHDKSSKPLKPLKEGESVRVQQGKLWKPAEVLQKLPEPRSYLIKSGGGTYRRNRKHLMKTEEPIPSDDTVHIEEPASSSPHTLSCEESQAPCQTNASPESSKVTTTRS